MAAEQTLDIMDFVVNKGHGVTGLASMGLNHVPDKYLLPPEERFDASKIISSESIPVIDVSNWDDHEVAKSICNAATHFGFFQIINHGIPMEVMDSIQRAAHRFFEMPTAEKVKYKRDGVGTGRTSVKLGTSFCPDKEKVLEWRDSLTLHYFSEEDASQSWPLICKNEVLDYYKKVEELVKKMYNVLLKGLNISTGFDESKKSLLMGLKAINLNYYPCCPNPELTVGIGRHSDASALTVLLQDVGGLYVRAPEGGFWIPIPPRRGALVINIGDMLQLISNGKYKSIEHMAVANSRKNRVSVSVFAAPAPNQVVAPLVEVLESTGEKAAYREIVLSDYFKYFFGKAHDGKATIDWAKI